MFVSKHARDQLERRVGSGETDRILGELERLYGDPDAVAIDVATLPTIQHDGSGSNGDTVVVIVRGGEVTTVMLRRSWNQPFTPEALNVDRVEYRR